MSTTRQQITGDYVDLENWLKPGDVVVSVNATGTAITIERDAPPPPPPTSEYSVIAVTTGRETTPRLNILIDGFWQPIGRSHGGTLHVWADSVLRADVASGDTVIHEVLHS
jgi:hypothetical protein